MMDKRLPPLALLSFGALLWAACTPPPPADAGPDPDPGCDRNIDCGQGSICEKEPGEDVGVCIPVFCVSDADCDEAEYCHLRSGFCISRLSCNPAAPEAVCGPGEACTYVDGQPHCTPTGDLAAAASCQVAPNPVIVSDGNDIELRAVGFDAGGKLVPHLSFAFAGGGSIGTVTANKLAAACASGICEGTVTATAGRGSATCDADVKVYAAPAAGDFRVVLFDSTTGAPVAGARATLTVSGVVQEATSATSADGVATWTGITLADVDAVSVFPNGHQWQTLVGPAGNDVALYTVPIPDETKVAGVKGDFDFGTVHSQGDIKLGLAGMSISSSITDLDFSTLLGEIADYNIVLEGVTDSQGEMVPLPSGLVLMLADEPLKPNFVTMGDPGSRILWALGGKIRLSQIGDIISSVTASDDVNVGQILASVLPFFAKFDHATVTGLELSNVTRPEPTAEDVPIPYGDWDFPEVTGVPLATLLQDSVTYSVPTMPCVPGSGSGGECADKAYASGAVLLTGAIVPGIGLVPLGLTAGLDDPDDTDSNDQRDGKLDYLPPDEGNATPPAKGNAVLDYAPPHDGLEGSLFVTIAIALDIDGLTEGSLGASTIMHVTTKYNDTNTFPGGSFLDHQGGTWNTASNDNRTFTLSAVGEAEFYRLNLNNGDKEWNIWFPSGTTEISTASLRPSDLSPAANAETSREAGADIQAFRLGTGYDGLKPGDFDALVEFNGTNFDNLLYYMGGWSSQACEAQEDGATTTPFCQTLAN